MENYLLYIAIASATIASPGPGVVLTISNSLKYGFRGTVTGIFGIAFGMLSIAMISASSLAVILTASASAFTILKYIGAAYLIYLGIKMWRSSSKFDVKNKESIKSNKVKFIEGLLITLLNPKPIFFFMALFPQFINTSGDYLTQFLLLSTTFSTLVVTIHCIYAVFAKVSRSRLSSERGNKAISKTSGSVYILFGLGLAASNKQV